MRLHCSLLECTRVFIRRILRAHSWIDEKMNAPITNSGNREPEKRELERHKLLISENLLKSGSKLHAHTQYLCTASTCRQPVHFHRKTRFRRETKVDEVFDDDTTAMLNGFSTWRFSAGINLPRSPKRITIIRAGPPRATFCEALSSNSRPVQDEISSSWWSFYWRRWRTWG